MNKIKVVVDASAPNYADVKKVLEEKGMEVIVHQSTFDFDNEIIKQINQLKAFESMYFKNPQYQKALQDNLLNDPDFKQIIPKVKKSKF